MATDAAFSLTGITAANRQMDGSWILSYSGGTVTIPTDISDNNGGVDAYVATNGSTSGSDWWKWLKKQASKIWS